MSIGDNTDYTKLQLQEQDFVTLDWANDTDYAVDSLVYEHGLGYAPIAIVYSGAYHAGDKANNFSGFQIPITEVSGASGGFASLYANIYFTLDYQFITFARQSLRTANADTGTLAFKYFLFKQPAQA